MRLSASLLVVQAGLSLTAPAPIPPYLLTRTPEIYNASLPNITIFATGGTIAGSADTSDQTTGYQSGVLGVDLLSDAVPDIHNVSNPKGIQIANVGSNNMTPDVLLNLTQQIQREVDDPYCQGVVVTHGTDTLEESAFFIDVTTSTEKPIVFVGSMRPATAISADGPINLLEAVTLASSPKGKGRGTMIVLNDRISSAYYTTKTNANSLDTFRAVEQGFLGFFLNIKPHFYYQPSLPVGKPYFNLSETTSLPQVDILYGYQDVNPKLPALAVSAGAEGLILAGMGAGYWTDTGNEAIADIVRDQDIPIVYSHRMADGFSEKEPNFGYDGGLLNPQKARILLQLSLNSGYDHIELQNLLTPDGL